MVQWPINGPIENNPSERQSGAWQIERQLPVFLLGVAEIYIYTYIYISLKENQLNPLRAVVVVVVLCAHLATQS